jgi:hypothetical protein
MHHYRGVQLTIRLMLWFDVPWLHVKFLFAGQSLVASVLLELDNVVAKTGGAVGGGHFFC